MYITSPSGRDSPTFGRSLWANVPAIPGSSRGPHRDTWCGFVSCLRGWAPNTVVLVVIGMSACNNARRSPYRETGWCSRICFRGVATGGLATIGAARVPHINELCQQTVHLGASFLCGFSFGLDCVPGAGGCITCGLHDVKLSLARCCCCLGPKGFGTGRRLLQGPDGSLVRCTTARSTKSYRIHGIPL